MRTRKRPPRIRKEVWMQVKDPAQIRRWRKQQHFSQRDLAFLVRRSQTAIYAVETGRLRNIEEDFALALAARLNVPWEDLFIAHEQVIMPGVTSDASSVSEQVA